MVTNKLYLDDRNNDFIVLCKLGSHTISGCRVIGVGPPESPPPPHPVQGSKKKPSLNRVKVFARTASNTELLITELVLPYARAIIDQSTVEYFLDAHKRGSRLSPRIILILNVFFFNIFNFAIAIPYINVYLQLTLLSNRNLFLYCYFLTSFFSLIFNINFFLFYLQEM